MRVLIVEDEPNLGRQLRATLEGAGYAIDLATDGEDGHFLGSTENYDAIILDLGLPEVDGLTVLDRWRREGKDTPVLVLTARDSWSDKVAGLDAGADDYLAKPFQTEELIARLRALIRRGMMAQALWTSFGGPGVVPVISSICSPSEIVTANRWGYALRLGQRFSGGVADALVGSRLALRGESLDFHVESDHAILYGEAVERRHKTLAAAFGVEARLITA